MATGEVAMSYAPGVVERAMKVQEVIVRALAGQLSWIQAADILQLSPRSVRRWRWRLERDGYDGLFDRRRRVPSPKRAPVAEVQRVLALYRDRYQGFNVRHFHQLARREHGVAFCYAFVKKVLQAQAWSRAIGSGARRAPASANCSISTAAATTGCPRRPSAGSRSSRWSTTRPNSCSTPSSTRAAKVLRPS
jgi:hypothetical protein